MAQRIATEYINASLQLSEVQMAEFIHTVGDPHVRQRIKVLDGGGQEVVLVDDEGEELHLPFDRRDGYYICNASFRLVKPRITNVVRRLFAAFKGSGIVSRVYEGIIVMYHYELGRVRKIIEHHGESTRLVYEYKNTLEELKRLFHSDDVEKEIFQIQQRINELLDQRIKLMYVHDIELIDHKLTHYTQRLFALEA